MVFSLLYSVLVAVYVVSIITIIVVILSENRSPVKSLAWVTVLLLLPVAGIILYLVFGRSIKNTRMISRRNRRRLRKKESFRKVKLDRLGLSDASVQQIRLARTLAGAIYYPGNEVALFVDGGEKFKSLLADIASARKYINLQYYIISDDEIGRKIGEALIERANAGVKVRIIYDHVGSFRTKNKFFAMLESHGIEVYPFFKVAFPTLGTRVNWRNHRKIAIIDGEIGYIGGMNVADRYIDGGQDFNLWRDAHLRIKGPAAGALQYSFAVDWNFMGKPLIECDTPKSAEKGRLPEGAGMQLLTSGPTSQWSNISFLFIKAIGNARKRVYMQTPYFLPTEGLLKALQTAALSGVDVRLMLPRRSDSRMLDAASHSYILECLRAGIKVYFFNAGMLHAKTLLVDDEFASVGSTNLDFRSFEHNFEANMQIYSKEFNSRLAEMYIHDMHESERVHQAQWQQRPLMKKAVESVTRLLSPIL